MKWFSQAYATKTNPDIPTFDRDDSAKPYVYWLRQRCLNRGEPEECNEANRTFEHNLLAEPGDIGVDEIDDLFVRRGRAFSSRIELIEPMSEGTHSR